MLRVDGGRVRLALARASPLASLSLDGELRGQVAVRSRLSDPVVNLEGSVDRFDLDRHPLGDVLSLRGRYQGKVLRFEDVHARKGTSRYDVASVRIAFPAHGRVDVEAIVSARALELRDLLSTVRLDKKPPWPLLGGALREARARLRYVQGGRQDPKEALLAVDLDATQARFRGVSLGSTSLHAEATFGGRASLRAFVRGDVMGSQVHVDRLALEGSSWQGQIALRNLDVAALVRAAKGQPGGDTVAAPSAARAWVSGDLNMSSVDPGDPAHSRATFVPTAVRAILGGQNVRLRPNGSPFVLAGDAITVPMLAFDVGNPGQQPGVATAHASIASLSQSPELDAALAIPPMPLQALVGLVPDLQRAKGTFDLALTAKGPIDAPTLGGWLRASATAATVGWIPSELHDVDIAVAVSPHALTIGHARARLGHGTVDVTGSLTMHGLVPGSADFGVRTKGVRLAIGKGISATFDAATHALIDVPVLLSDRPHAIVVTGAVDVRGLTYKLPPGIPLNVTALAPLATWVARPHSSPAHAGTGSKRELVDLDLSLHLHPGGPLGFVSRAVGSLLPVPHDLWLGGTNVRPELVARRGATQQGGKGHAIRVRF